MLCLTEVRGYLRFAAPGYSDARQDSRIIRWCTSRFPYQPQYQPWYQSQNTLRPQWLEEVFFLQNQLPVSRLRLTSLSPPKGGEQGTRLRLRPETSWELNREGEKSRDETAETETDSKPDTAATKLEGSYQGSLP